MSFCTALSTLKENALDTESKQVVSDMSFIPYSNNDLTDNVADSTVYF